MAVVSHHVLEESGRTIAYIPDFLVLFGASGVDIFFVISGFIMAYTTAGMAVGVSAGKSFLLRRLLRIYPLYWLCLLLVCASHAVGLSKSFQMNLSSGIRAALLIPSPLPAITVAWTLSYELYFYAIFALAIIFISKHLRRMAITLSILSLLAASNFVAAIRPDTGRHLAFLTNPLVLEFTFGLAIAEFCRALSPKIGRLVIAIGFAALFLSAVWGPHSNTEGLNVSYRFLLWGLPATAIVWGVVAIDNRTHTKSRLLLLLGDASYSIYLTHALVMTTYGRILKDRLFQPLYGLPLALMAELTSILVGTLTFLIIEKPLLSALKRVAFGKTAPHPGIVSKSTGPVEACEQPTL